MLQVGQFVSVNTDNEFTLYKILSIENDGSFLVRSYWAELTAPNASNLDAFSLRSDCSRITLMPPFQIIQQESISQKDEDAIAQFHKIESGIQHRALEMTRLVELGKAAMGNGDFKGAIGFFTEAAPFSKYSIETYFLRGTSYLHAQELPEAIADFEYVLSVEPRHKEVLLASIAAYSLYDKKEKAAEKKQQLLQFYPDFN